MIKSYFLAEIPLRQNTIHCYQNLVWMTGHFGYGRSNVFLVTPNIYDVNWDNKNF